MTLPEESDVGLKLTGREAVCRAQSSFWGRSEFRVRCGLHTGHEGPHICVGPTPDVSWEWTDEQFPTRYPNDPR